MRIDSHSCLHSEVAYLCNCPLQMYACFILNGQDICAGITETDKVPVGVHDHQMDVKRFFSHFPDIFNDGKSK